MVSIKNQMDIITLGDTVRHVCWPYAYCAAEPVGGASAFTDEFRRDASAIWEKVAVRLSQRLKARK